MATNPISGDADKIWKNKCCLVKNIVSDDMLKHINTMLELEALRGSEISNQVPGSQEFYNPLYLNVLNQILRDKIKKLVQKESLYSTYTFYRKYYQGQKLEKHVDRPSCEISFSLCLAMKDKTNPWAIYFEDTDTDTVFEAKPEVGDGVIYLGCVTPHWREVCEQEWHKQVFFHYSTDPQLEFDLKGRAVSTSQAMENYFIKYVLEQN